MKRELSQKLLKQGIAATRAGQAKDARQHLVDAIELDPDNENAWLWLSGVVDSTTERQHCLEQVLKLNPDNTYARAGLASLEKLTTQGVPLEIEPPPLMDTGVQPDQDLTSGENCPFCDRRVSARSTTCSHCRRALVVACPTCETLLDIEETACSTCGHHIGDWRQGVAYYADLGDAYLANLKADLAIATWQNVVEMDASYPHAYVRLGEAQTIAADLEGARASFEQAVSQAANPGAAQLALGRIYERQHLWDEAQNAYEQAVAADESSAVAHLSLGRFLAEGKAFQASFIHIRRATELDRENAEAWFLLGQLYEAAQERGRAIQAYEQASGLAARKVPDNILWCERAAERIERLRPSLPRGVTRNWPETVRQTTGLALIPVIAALVNAGLRPWQIAPLDYLAIGLATLGAYFLVSASASPRNPGMRALLGQDGLSHPAMRTTLGWIGGLLWVAGSLFIILVPALA